MSAAEIFTDTAPEIRAIQKKAIGSSFYTAMRLMPKAEREAMFAVYAFCRAVDDIADDGIGTRAERHAALDGWRDDLTKLYAGGDGGRAAYLSAAVNGFHLRKQDFLDTVDGMDMDAAEDICAPSLATLDLYCDRVASAVGRLSIKIFGMDENPGFALAYHLGRALQLTNILRDLDEDAKINRLYLPREYLNDAGIAISNPAGIVADPRVDGVCRAVAALAHKNYMEADKIMDVRPKGRLRTPKLMGAVYSEILRETEKAGWAPPRERISLGRLKLLKIVAATGLFA